MTWEIRVTLKSDATFGRGDGVAGLVDEEVEHDTSTGLPFLRGRTLKGLLVEECANVLYALDAQQSSKAEDYKGRARDLFGRAGSTLSDDGALQVGPALLTADLRQAVAAALGEPDSALRPADVLESLTAIRRQTAVDEQSGAPAEGSLRSMRVVLRETVFVARLDFAATPEPAALALLAACILGFRRGGIGRNRGRGRLTARLLENGTDATTAHFARFRQDVTGGSS